MIIFGIVATSRKFGFWKFLWSFDIVTFLFLFLNFILFKLNLKLRNR